MPEKFLDAFKNLAPNLSARTKKSLEIKKELRESREKGNWDYKRGDFTTSFMVEGEPSRTTTEMIRGLERVVLNRINQLLSERSQKGDANPVVLVDFGGMLSLSPCKIALTLREEIASGKLIIISTSLGLDAPSEIKALPKKGNFKFNQSEVAVLNEALSLVHFVNADAAELPRVKIQLPNGTNYSLHGAIDIIHERLALTHSHKPDIDLPLLARELNKDGVIFLGSHKPIKKMGDPDNDMDVRYEAFEKGLKNLEATNLTKIDCAEESYGNYDVFLKHGAAPLKLD